MVGFDKQNAMAEDVLTNYKGKVTAITKATRAGATFSILKRACELKQKTVIIAPYKEIFNQTLNDVVETFPPEAKPKIIRITANKEMCKKIKYEIEQYPILEKFPSHSLPRCQSCEYNEPQKCEFQKNLSIDNWDILAITYAKLKAIHKGKSATSRLILEKIRTADNLILDEFTTGILHSSPSVEITDIYDKFQREFDDSENRALYPETNSEGEFWAGMNLFVIIAKHKGDFLKPGEHMIYENDAAEYGNFFDENTSECWKIIKRLAIQEGKNIEILQQILQVITAKRLVAIKSKDGKVQIQPIEDMTQKTIRSYDYLKDFLKECEIKNKVVALVDACLPTLNFESLLEVEVASFLWGDPLETNKSQLIICDTRKFGKTEFFKETNLQKKLKTLINLACRLHTPSVILVATMNKQIHNIIKYWIKKEEIPKVTVTYYRSELSRGITPDKNHNVLILVGGPYLPKLAYLAETLGTEKNCLQEAYNKSDVKSEFINLIGRVKDPSGTRKSVVYATGITYPEIINLIEQKDVPSPLIFKFLTTGADPLDFEIASKVFLNPELPGKFNDIHFDLPIFVKILRKIVIEEKSLTLGEIVPQHVEPLKNFVETYPDFLAKAGIVVVKSSRGYRLSNRQ